MKKLSNFFKGAFASDFDEALLSLKVRFENSGDLNRPEKY